MSSNFKFLIASALLACCFALKLKDGCVGTQRQEVASKTNPLYYRSENGQWLQMYQIGVKDNKFQYSVASNTQVLIACPGSSKIKVAKRGQVIQGDAFVATCDGGTLSADVNGDLINFSLGDTQCESPLQFSYMEEKSSECPIGQWIRTGFHISLDRQKIFQPVVEVCLHKSKMLTFFTKNSWTKQISAPIDLQRRPRWDSAIFSDDARQNLIRLYEENDQVQRRLAPEQDFMLPTMQQCANLMENVAPQSKILAPTWEKLEEAVRETEELAIIYTGTSNGVAVETHRFRAHFLDQENKLTRIPDFFWKIVHHPGQKEENYAMVGFNKNQSEILSSTLAEDIERLQAPCFALQNSMSLKMCVPVNFVLDNFPEAAAFNHLRA